MVEQAVTVVSSQVCSGYDDRLLLGDPRAFGPREDRPGRTAWCLCCRSLSSRQPFGSAEGRQRL